jgi:hypothetical protein
VDDLLIIGAHDKLIQYRKDEIMKARGEDDSTLALDIKDLGVATSFLNMAITRLGHGRIHLGQPSYALSLVQKWTKDPIPSSRPILEQPKRPETNAEEMRPQEILEYQQLLGAISHLAIATRPDLSYAVGVAARRASRPTQRDRAVLCQILAYIAATPDHGITYKPDTDKHISHLCHVDASYADDLDTHRSTSGLVVTMAGGPIAWASRRQAWVALSTCEAELNALTEGVRETEWTRVLINEVLGLTGDERCLSTTIRCDNTAALQSIERGTSRRNTRHLVVRLAYLRERCESSIKLEYVPSAENIADALTKALPASTLAHLRDMMSVVAPDDPPSAAPQSSHAGGV